MSNNVDRLFKQKLGEHSLPPSPQAWEKVEAHLTKKNKGIVWFRVAAVLALAGLLTFALLQQGKEDQEQHLANELPVKADQKKTPVSVPEQAPVLAQHDPKTKKTTVTKQKKQTTTPSQPLKTNAVQTSEPLNEEKKLEEQVIKSEPTIAQAASRKSITLTFSLPALKETENAQNTLTAAAAEEKKTTLQKAADKAREIRTGDVLGNLRDAKNDLFAWEFKKDKPKNNNGSY